MFEEPLQQQLMKYFVTPDKIIFLKMNIEIFDAKYERVCECQMIVQRCNNALSTTNAQWTPRNVRIYFNNHKMIYLTSQHH
jgi:hypothetical protein